MLGAGRLASVITGATIDASGASKVSVFVTEELNSEASGASKIQYSGNPTSVENKTSGASSVRQK